MTKSRNSLRHKLICALVSIIFLISCVVPPTGSAQSMASLNLPAPGTMLSISAGFHPPLVIGLRLDPVNPLQFSFIINSGQSGLQGDALQGEANKLIKYFMASLTVPEDELWVNLSPYESQRIISETFGQTEMGRDLLAQDYILKQLTASLIHPEKDLGKEFWDRVYAKSQEMFGTTDIPVNTFNKIWILPEKATVYEHEGTAYLIESHMRVMLEQDYAAVVQNLGSEKFGTDVLEAGQTEEISAVGAAIIREVLIPEIEKEVNEGKTFARLRQITNSLILALWFKQNLRQSLLGEVYVDRQKIVGIEIEDKTIKDQIYQQYLEAFKTGVYDFIKDEYDPVKQEIISRKYFSGGFQVDPAMISIEEISGPLDSLLPEQQARIRDFAMTSAEAGPINEFDVAFQDVGPEGVNEAPKERLARFPQTRDPAMLESQMAERLSATYRVVSTSGANMVAADVLPLVTTASTEGELRQIQSFADQNLPNLQDNEMVSRRIASRRRELSRDRAMVAKPVLVVDDHAGVRAMVQDHVRALGYPVQTAASGEEAREMFQRDPQQFSGLITDIRMGDDKMDGLQLSREVKVLNPALRVVVMSTMIGPEDAKDFQAASDNIAVAFGKADVGQILTKERLTELFGPAETADPAMVSRGWPEELLQRRFGVSSGDLLSSVAGSRQLFLGLGAMTGYAFRFERSSAPGAIVTLTIRALEREVIARYDDEARVAELLSETEEELGLAIRPGARVATFEDQLQASLGQRVDLGRVTDATTFRSLGLRVEEILRLMRYFDASYFAMNPSLEYRFGVDSTIGELRTAVRRMQLDADPAMVGDTEFWGLEDILADPNAPLELLLEKREMLRNRETNLAQKRQSLIEAADRLRDIDTPEARDNVAFFVEREGAVVIDAQLVAWMRERFDVRIAQLIEIRREEMADDDEMRIEEALASANATNALRALEQSLSEELEFVRSVPDEQFRVEEIADALAAIETYLAIPGLSRDSSARGLTLDNLLSGDLLTEAERAEYDRVLKEGTMQEREAKRMELVERRVSLRASRGTEVWSPDLSDLNNLIRSFEIKMKIGIPSGFDPAMVSREERVNNVGGIDLNPALLDLQIKRDGNGIPLPLTDQPLEEMHIEGFIPIILNVTPITNLPLLLGLGNGRENAQQVSLRN